MATDLIGHCKCWADWYRCYNDAPPTLNTLRRAFTALIRWAFTKPENMGGGLGELLKCYTYSSTGKSKITISPVSVKDPGDTEQVPGIFISLDEGVKYAKPGMNTLLSESEDTATRYHVTQATTKVTITCKDFDADICCTMADVVVMFLFAITERLFRTWRWLRIYDLESQTEPKLTTKSESDTTKWYESKVTFNIVYDYNVLVTEDSKRLKDYSLEPSGS